MDYQAFGEDGMGWEEEQGGRLPKYPPAGAYRELAWGSEAPGAMGKGWG